MIRLLNIPNIGTVKELRKTFDTFIQPPSARYIDAELSFLKELELITSNGSSGKLTELGNMVSALQTEPCEALTLIMAYKLYCFREVSAILAVIDATSGSISKLFTISTSGNSKNNNLIKKFKRVIQDFDNKYGDHIAILKIFKTYEKKRQDREKLREWCYKYFLKRDVLEDAYKTYMRMKRRYWNVLLKLKPSDVDKEIIKEDLIYRILASFIYGYKLNILEHAHDRILTLDKQNVSIDKDSFLKKNNIKNSPMIYTQLFQGSSKRVSAKIVSKISKKAIEILSRVM